MGTNNNCNSRRDDCRICRIDRKRLFGTAARDASEASRAAVPKDWARCANIASRPRAIPSILQIPQSSFLLLLFAFLLLGLLGSNGELSVSVATAGHSHTQDPSGSSLALHGADANRSG